MEECIKIRNKQGGCKVGEAVFTTAGKLNAKYVIHTVGPRWNNGNSEEEIKLLNCYVNTLKIAEELNCKSIAFPNISTGIYKFPKGKAAEIAIQAVNNYNTSIINKIIFVCFDEENYYI